ncbi:uncharacterized protein LOC131223133 isoform X2 [Magnolia sinica]|uniref:uncharacterized protein LOC131223133 isoform X2 n=1 Tax=Magnolia sinica TaxID=86752 RepID=UPI0026588415|nr:uncharacterized protein LOC131223133 isoform X2 [Magnolia sinica]
MVVKMMKWSPWPPATVKRFEVKVKLLKLEGLEGAVDEKGKKKKKVVVVEMRWKGPKVGLVSLRRRERRNVSKEGRFAAETDVVEFGDEFENVCGFSATQKENSFNAWDVSFSILYISLSFVEIRMSQDSLETLQQPNNNGSDNNNDIGSSNNDGDDNSNNNMPESFLRRMTSYVSPYGRVKKKKKKTTMVGPDQQQPEELSDSRPSGRFSAGDTTDESVAAFDTDSPDDEADPAPVEQLGYGSIASAATAAADGSAVYYSHGSGSEEVGLVSQSESSVSSVARSGLPPKGGGLLSWKRRRLSFRTGRRKEEPLLNKANGEDGGDDIDFARRQLGSSSDESRSSSKRANGKVVESVFGGEDFAIGSWEEKELISRDSQSKLKASVFFASIDQRSESAAGESACTALVAVIANWLQTNQGTIPTKSEFDSLIRDGSLEWRKLCDNETYRDRFPDKHFDLETVIQAEIRPISVSSEKSFVGFFGPENFELLQGAMSFDSIWDEISSNVEDGGPQVYIVSWNDHFFVLMVDADAYYIIDTLGERLFEGCNQAYILRFDDTTLMSRVPENAADGGKDDVCKEEAKETVGSMEESGNVGSGRDDDQVICSGRECCREFVKRFLAAIPLRELEMEVKKEMVSGVSLLKRLQIDFHYTATTNLSLSCPSSGMTAVIVETNNA